MRTDPILDRFDRLARRDGHRPLVATHARCASRGEIDAWADAAAAKALSAGASEGGYILLRCVNGAGFLAALVGVRRAGLVPVLADWASPAAERARVAEAMGIAAEMACDDVFPQDAASFRIEQLPAAPTSPPAGASYVKLTSGSSGVPSGVAFSAEALAADDDQLAATMGLHAADRFVAAIPWSHSYALSSLVMPALRRGSMLLVPADSSPWAPLEIARELEGTVFPTVPVYLGALGALAAPPVWPKTLRLVISAGAPLSPETAARFQERFDRNAHVFYGASESGGITFDRDGTAALRGTVGTPVDGVTVALDPDGVVSVRSEAVGECHVPAPEERLTNGVFTSADLGGFTSEGELRLLGRADALINVGGKKVQPQEIEAVLRAMPGVRDAVVLGMPAENDGRTVVRAFVVCELSSLSYADIASWCRRHLAGHKVPRSIVRLEAIPRTPRGKVDREALTQLPTVAPR